MGIPGTGYLLCKINCGNATKTVRQIIEKDKCIVQLNEEVIKGQIKELIRGSVEETLNGLLEAEAQKLTQAAKYERSQDRQGYRSGYYHCNLTITSGDVML